MTGLIDLFSARQVKKRTCIEGFFKTRPHIDGFFNPPMQVRVKKKLQQCDM